ncbi:MAG: hypothetical protein ACUVUD_00905 [bacterium]
MRFNWVDLTTIGVVATGAAIQFLRATKDFSLVLYETFFLIAALIAAVRLIIPLHQFTALPEAIVFIGVFVVLSMLGLLLAHGLNQIFEFGFGVFNHFIGLLLGIACGIVFGHAVLRTVVITYRLSRPEVVEFVHRSWMASQILYFGAFRELLGILRVARYHNI